MNKINICLVGTVNYLKQALTACEMLHKNNTEISNFYICVPDIDKYNSADIQNEVNSLTVGYTVKLVSPNQCSVKSFYGDMSFYYTAFELCCSLKPTIMKYVFDNTNCDKVIYVDTDIYCLNNINELADTLNSHNILLTIHRNKPYLDNQSSFYQDLSLFGSGAYNGGVIGVKRGEVGLSFIDWFGKSIEKGCFDDWRSPIEERMCPHSSFFGDQRWLDLVPSLFDGVYISRNIGANCSHWNIDGEELTTVDNKIYCNNNLITLLHLSEFNENNKYIWAGRNLTKSTTWVEIIDVYCSVLNKFNSLKFSVEYGFMRFSDGEVIQRNARRAYFKLLSYGKRLGDATPFNSKQVIKVSSHKQNSYDHISPEYRKVTLDGAFPFMIETVMPSWRYLGVESAQKYYADVRNPGTGFVSRDEAHILLNSAMLFPNSPALEIGCWMGWSAAHIAISEVSELHIVDPVLDIEPWKSSVRNSLSAVGVIEKCRFYAMYSPDCFNALPKHKWGFIFIDGNHDNDGPLTDAVFACNVASENSLIMLHDLRAPAVSAALSYLKRNGWNTGLYITTQIMGVAWRGKVTPISHSFDKRFPFNIPYHLDEFNVISN